MRYVSCKAPKGLETAKQVRAWYKAGNDFTTLGLDAQHATYLCKREVEKYGVKLEVRYGQNLEKVLVLP